MYINIKKFRYIHRKCKNASGTYMHTYIHIYILKEYFLKINIVIIHGKHIAYKYIYTHGIISKIIFLPVKTR